ncbi:BUD13 homolog [Ptychodera flava]|uniref:BUD13 homolog n=1 Tax=Ptychodera flava TaxID=63121 RepID=UPI00396AA794
MAALSKQEYLKRYLSNAEDEPQKKKKRKKPKTGSKGASVRILDDDISLESFAPKVEDIEEAPFQDEAPQVVGMIDERPEEVIQLEKYQAGNKWKQMGRREEAISDSPSPRRRHDSDSDQSPVRKGHRQRHDSDDDMSPPRRTRHDSDSDLSPPRGRSDKKKSRHDSSDSDLSPPRAKTSQSKSSARRQRHDSDSDSDPDLSPPRTHSGSRQYDSDQSPPRRSRQKSDHKSRNSDSDQSPPRKGKRRRKGRHDSDSDQSPPRKHSLGGDSKKPTKTLSGTKAGLSDAATLRRENEERRIREKEMFAKMSRDVSGQDAETVYRDKGGRKRNLKLEKIKEREEEAKKAEEVEKYMEWGRGVAQTKTARDTAEDHVYEMSKPLARYRDDKDLDEMLKEKDREGDPMLAFLKKKQAKKAEKAGIPEKPRYKGPEPPPNRFNIWPGYRWDGVDRSNGYEKKWFQKKNDKKAMTEIAYKWSIEDM